MAFPNYKELNNLKTISEIENEIFLLTKNLLDFRIKRATNKNVQPHLFIHTKRRLAQLQFKKTVLLKNNKN